MPRLTEAERNERRKRVQDDALELVCARGQFNFRLDGKEIKRLYVLAGKREKPVSAMVREWVIERLELEETSKHAAPLWAKDFEQRLALTEAFVFSAVSAQNLSAGRKKEAIQRRLREYVQRHCNLEGGQELLDLM